MDSQNFVDLDVSGYMDTSAVGLDPFFLIFLFFRMMLLGLVDVKSVKYATLSNPHVSVFKQCLH